MEMKVLFKNWIVFLVFIVTCSCTGLKNEIEANNYFYGVKLFNKNLGISTTYFGDMKFESFNNHNLKHIASLIKNIDLLKDKRILMYSTTTSEPSYETILFYDENNALNDGVVLNDLKNNFVLYKKSDGIKCVFLLLKSTSLVNKGNNSTLLIDGKTIISTITFDNKELEKTNYFDIFNGVKELDNYLVAREKLKNAPLQKNNEQNFNQFQFLATINSFISNNKEYDSLISKSEKRLKNIYQPYVDSLLLKRNVEREKSVIDEIIDLSKSEKVVMLNENHWCPKHRMLAFQLLDKLKKNGFNYLAIEAISPMMDSILNIRHFPSKETGYYTREPYFAHFIRKAKKLGFQIVEYDNMEESIDRELSQAINLKKILDKDSNAKIFVYAGIDHILEVNSSKKRMAECFKEITGINPLTFNQVKVVADILSDLEVFPSSDFSGFNNLTTNVDYFIINNLKPNLKEVYFNEEFEQFTLKINNLKNYLNEDVLIKVYNVNEYKLLKSNAIPVFIFTDKLKGREIVFDLPKGEYFVKVLSNKDDRLFGGLISVK
jgi:hypothetical protein